MRLFKQSVVVVLRFPEGTLGILQLPRAGFHTLFQHGFGNAQVILCGFQRRALVVDVNLNNPADGQEEQNAFHQPLPIVRLGGGADV
jgi:hypothetical protein